MIPWNRACNLLQYSCLENPMDRGAWWATVYRVAKSQTQLSDFHTHTQWLEWGFPGGSDGKESTCNAGDLGLIPGLGPWRRERLPTPVFLSRESHGQRSLVGYSPWCCKELDMTEATEHTYTSLCAKSLQSCPTLCSPMDCSLPGSSVHGIF